MKCALRLVLMWLAFAAGLPLASPPFLLVVAGITMTASPATAQTSGGYSRLGVALLNAAAMVPN